MKKKISTDLSKLSNLPEPLLDKLLGLTAYCISNAVYESLLDNEQFTELDMGYGTLIVKHDLKDLKLKFIPSEDLEMDLKNVNSGGKPELYHKIEKAVVAKLNDLYKELI